MSYAEGASDCTPAVLGGDPSVTSTGGMPEDLTVSDERRLEEAAVDVASQDNTLGPVPGIKRVFVVIELDDGSAQEVEIHNARAATIARTDQQWLPPEIRAGRKPIIPNPPQPSIVRLTVTGVTTWIWRRLR